MKHIAELSTFLVLSVLSPSTSLGAENVSAQLTNAQELIGTSLTDRYFKGDYPVRLAKGLSGEWVRAKDLSQQAAVNGEEMTRVCATKPVIIDASVPEELRLTMIMDTTGAPFDIKYSSAGGDIYLSHADVVYLLQSITNGGAELGEGDLGFFSAVLGQLSGSATILRPSDDILVVQIGQRLDMYGALRDGIGVADERNT